MSRPQPGPTEASDVVAALLWLALQVGALAWLVYLAFSFDWLTGWFSFGVLAGR